MSKFIIPQAAIDAGESAAYQNNTIDRFGKLYLSELILNNMIKSGIVAAAPHIIEANSNVDCYKLAEPFFLPRDHLEASEKGFTGDEYDYEYAQGYNDGLEKMAQLVEEKIIGANKPSRYFIRHKI